MILWENCGSWSAGLAEPKGVGSDRPGFHGYVVQEANTNANRFCTHDVIHLQVTAPQHAADAGEGLRRPLCLPLGCPLPISLSIGKPFVCADGCNAWFSAITWREGIGITYQGWAAGINPYEKKRVSR
jgi:hypothetical protein